MLIPIENPKTIDVGLGISLMPRSYEWKRWSYCDLTACRTDFIVIFDDETKNYYLPFSSITCWGNVTTAHALSTVDYILSHTLDTYLLNHYYDYRLGLRYEIQQDAIFFASLKRNLRGYKHTRKMTPVIRYELRHRIDFIMSSLPRRDAEKCLAEDYAVYIERIDNGDF